MTDLPGEDLLVEVTVPTDAEDFAACVFLDLGTRGVQPLPGPGDGTVLQAWFDAALEPEALVADAVSRLAAYLPGASFSPRWSRVPRHDWVAETRHNFVPIPAGDHFLIHASWNRPADLQGRLPVQVDPGEAFGTGSHETTRLCVTLLERHFDGGHRRVLDAGCGSGILLIAAARWLAKLRAEGRAGRPGDYAFAGIDIEEPSVEVSRKNLALNGVEVPADIRLCDLEHFSEPPFDWVFANILSGVILANRRKLDTLLKPGGRILLTGVLASEEPSFLPPVLELGWVLRERAQEGEWAAWVFGKPPA